MIAGRTPVLVHNVGGLKPGLCPVDPSVDHGKIGAMATKDRLHREGYTDISDEVRFVDSEDDVFIADFVAKNPVGQLVAIETKVNDSPISGHQAKGYPELTTTGARLQSSKLKGLGLMKGTTVRIPKLEIDRWLCPICRP